MVLNSLWPGDRYSICVWYIQIVFLREYDSFLPGMYAGSVSVYLAYQFQS